MRLAVYVTDQNIGWLFAQENLSNVLTGSRVSPGDFADLRFPLQLTEAFRSNGGCVMLV